MPTLTLVCATRNRPEHIKRRIPIWRRTGIDAVIVVDATSNPSEAREIETCCRENGATYVRFPPSLRDTRAKQRNLGVRLAATDWVLIQDDDDHIVAEFAHEVFDGSAQGMDYLWDGRGNHLLFHRRDNFLRLGGYPEDMVNAEDMVFSRLVRALSHGRVEGPVYRRIEAAKEPREIKRGTLSRAANLFWYPFTLMRFLERSPPEQRTSIMISAVMQPVRALSSQLHPVASLVVLPASFLAFVSGFGWHYVRKTVDPQFRRSLAFYRHAL